MSTLHKNIRNLIDDFSRGLVALYGDNLVSVIVYGSAVSPDYVRRHSDINVLVVLKDAGALSLQKASSFVRSFKFRAIAPLFMTPEYIRSSSDCFPIEFLDMKERYSVIFGQDVLAHEVVRLDHLRFQVEQELKSKLLLLRRDYLYKAQSKEELAQLICRLSTSLVHIFRNCLKLKGVDIIAGPEAVIDAMGAQFNLNTAAWKAAIVLRANKRALAYKKMQEVCAGLIKDLEALCLVVDAL